MPLRDRLDSAILQLPGDWEHIEYGKSHILLSMQYGGFIVGDRPDLEDPNHHLNFMPSFPLTDLTIQELQTTAASALLPTKAGWHWTLVSFLRSKQMQSNDLLADLPIERTVTSDDVHPKHSPAPAEAKRELTSIFEHVFTKPQFAIRKVERDLAKTPAKTVAERLQLNPGKYGEPRATGKRMTVTAAQILPILQKLAPARGTIR